MKRNHMKRRPIKKLLPLLLLCLVMGQDCGTPPSSPGADYCYGNDYSIFDGVPYGYEQNGVAGAYSAILNGIPSDDRRSTVQVRFGNGYCSGVVLGPRTILTAGHCGYASTTEHNVYLPTPIPDSDFVDLGPAYKAASHFVHPDYLKFVANPADLEARKADLMLLYMESDVPGPYIGTRFYDSTYLNKVCSGLVASGL